MHTLIYEIGEKIFGETPLNISRKTIGMCNEVYEIQYQTGSYILRMNKEKEWIYGTHKFLPLFQQLHIKTPEIIAEDYSKTEFPICYQFLNKLEGEDLGLVIQKLSPANLKEIAKEVSSIFDKFNSLPPAKDFGLITGLKEERRNSLFEAIEYQKETIIQRNQTSQVIDKEVMDLYNQILTDYKSYFLQVKPRLYYDDICSKNVMIYNGRFNGLVDLDFLMKGDYLEAIGRMTADWYGEENGEFYINEIINLQGLDEFQQKIIKVYAILNLVLWMSEEGIRFNGNSTGEVNWANVEKKKGKVINLYSKIK